MSQPQRQAPCGILQDAGELAVLSEDSGQIHHRHALVVAFSSEEELRQALADRHFAYRHGQAIEERIANG